ncbi:MAG TPA: HPP family protein [Xanthobacteraceae bacterium]|nr:HPP family protein [Xanthobacteraceae bacterium]
MTWQIVLWRGLGGAIAILTMQFLAGFGHAPLALVPFATSIVLVLGTPQMEAAQPRALVGGHLISTLVGLAVSYALGPSPFAAAIAVGLAMVAMYFARAFHPPAGIDPLIIVNESLPWSFLLTTVLPGALLLLSFAFLWHNALRRGEYPARWW